MLSIALARAYQQSFESHPNGTLAIAGGALNALGDVVAQIVQQFVSRFIFDFLVVPLTSRLCRCCKVCVSRPAQRTDAI